MKREQESGRDLPDLLTVREAARVLRISVDLAYALVRAGVVPVLRLGERRVVVPKEALFRWIQAQTALNQNVSSASVRST